MKLIKFLEDRDLTNNWIAKKANIDVYYIAQWKCNKCVPIKYWKIVQDITGGQVTMEDLWEDFMERKKNAKS